MTEEKFEQALIKAGVPFSKDGPDGKDLYIDDSLIVFKGEAFVTPDDRSFFNTDSDKSVALDALKLKDLKPMIQHYWKFHEKPKKRQRK